MVKLKRIQNKNTILQLHSKSSIFRGKKYRIHFKKGEEDFSYAISVSKHLGNAVKRNREKRWVRSIFYKYRFDINSGANVFIIIKQAGGLYTEAENEIFGFIKENFK